MQAKCIIVKGDLLPDNIVFTLLINRLHKPDCQNGFILDGFPRTLAQAKLLKDAQIDIHYILDIQINDKDIIQRLSGRRIHPASGRSYHIRYNPPKVAGIDDISGEPLIQRNDDKEETIQHRLKIYHNNTKPILAYYQKYSANNNTTKPKVLFLKGTSTQQEIFNTIWSEIGMRAAD
jgi:adenylate kinase